MSYANPLQKTLPGIRAWTWITLLLLAVVAFLGIRFVWNEWSAHRELQSRRAQAVAENKPEFAAMNDLHGWLAKNASRQQGQTWLDLNLELSSPYIVSQVGNLLLRLSDEQEDLFLDSTWERTSMSVPQIAWRWKPELLKDFVQEQQPLLNRLHAFASTPGLVDQPVQSNGARTQLPNVVHAATVQLLYLECEQAIRDRDSEKVMHCLDAMKRLRSKFAYPIYALVALGCQQELWRLAAIHDALNAEQLDAPMRQQLLGSLLGEPNLIVEAERTSQVTALFARLEEERKVEEGQERWKESMLPSARLDHWPHSTSSTASQSDSAIMRWALDALMAWEHYRDATVVRLGIMVYLDRNQKLPESLADLSSVGVGPMDWRVEFMKSRSSLQPLAAEFKWEREGEMRGALWLKRIQSTLAMPPEIPLPERIEFRQSVQGEASPGA